MVESTSLLTRQGLKALVGSNPTLSASEQHERGEQTVSDTVWGFGAVQRYFRSLERTKYPERVPKQYVSNPTLSAKLRNMGFSFPVFFSFAGYMGQVPHR